MIRGMVSRIRVIGGVFLLGLFGGASLWSLEDHGSFPFRWIYASRSLQSDAEMEELGEIARRAGEAGINGLVLSGGFDRLTMQDPGYLVRLAQIRRACQDFGIEIIPILLSAGYGSGLSRNPNLAAGLPVRDALFIARGGKAVLFPDPAVEVENGGFEEIGPAGPAGFTLNGRVGGTLDLDQKTVRSGKRSLLVDCSRTSPQDPGYIGQQLKVHPNRCYVLSCWVRTEEMDRPRDFSLGHIRFEVLGGPEKRRLQFHDPQVPPNSDWRPVAVGFNSLQYDTVEISIGNATSKGGRFWLDDLRLEEVGPVNVLRRPGTPLGVRGEVSGIVYEESVDFERIRDPGLNHRFDHEAPEILLTPNTRIDEGERLRISWYHSATLYQSQVSVCMSEPELYEIWDREVLAAQRRLEPAKYFLSMDEIRAGGTCAACQARGLTMGQILGDCITRQVEIIRRVNSAAEVFIWSDMLDPHHNARKDPYYLVAGSFDGSWEHIPKDLVIAIWGRKVRPGSFDHFTGLGFRTLGAAYYDADELSDLQGWLDAVSGNPLVTGMMYTTWLDKYELLPEFARRLREP